jgi:cobalt-zinc-cadmium efflux system protein
VSHHHDHTDHHDHNRSLGNITVAFWLNTGFAILELIGGFLTNSVAILSDALHDFGDSLSLGLSYYFEKKSTLSRDKAFSYGYKRFSLLGAFINSMVLVIGSVFIIQEAIERLFITEEVNARGMALLAIAGVLVNLAAMVRLRRGSSINERVVSLHFLEDVLGWLAVLIGSVVMIFFDIPILDPILSILIACFILFNVYKNLRKAFPIMLQGIPANVDMSAIKKRIRSIPGVRDVHDLHSWSMDGRYNILTAHIVLSADTPASRATQIKNETRECLKGQNVHHVTIETETEGEPCLLKDC